MANLPSTMNALTLAEHGGQFRLRLQTLPLPERHTGELLVKIERVGLNPIDSKLALSSDPQWHEPHIPGLDAVGVVVDACPGNSPAIGERVMWHANLAHQGVLSEYAKVPAYAASKVPDGVSAEQAAAVPCPGLTATLCFCKLAIQDGDTLLVEAGAGAIGQFAIQIAKCKGATVFATAAKPHHSYLKQLGADAVFDYHDADIAEQIKRELGQGQLTAVIDSVGGDATLRNIELLKYSGKIALLVEMPQIPSALLFRKAPSLHIISLGGAWLSSDLCAQQMMSFKGSLLLEYIAKGELKTPELIPVEFNAEAVTQAMHRQLDGSVFGKQVVYLG